MNFGEYLKSLRIERKITLREFARRLNKSAGNISKVERGLLPPPQDEAILQEYGKVLNIEEESEEMTQLKTLAAVDAGRIPSDVLSNEELVAKLPVFFRTATGSKLEQEKVAAFLEGLKKS